jgi:hypothetical protein
VSTAGTEIGRAVGMAVGSALPGTAGVAAVAAGPAAAPAASVQPRRATALTHMAHKHGFSAQSAMEERRGVGAPRRRRDLKGAGGAEVEHAWCPRGCLCPGQFSKVWWTGGTSDGFVPRVPFLRENQPRPRQSATALLDHPAAPFCSITVQLVGFAGISGRLSAPQRSGRPQGPWARVAQPFPPARQSQTTPWQL